MKMCLHQLNRPKIYVKIDGVGDCRVCKPDKENKKCPRYYPITVKKMEVRK